MARGGPERLGGLLSWWLALLLAAAALAALAAPAVAAGAADGPLQEVVRLAYRGVLGREPDPGGLRTYVRHMGHREHGPPRTPLWLCTVLLESEEFSRGGWGRPAEELAARLHEGITGCSDAGSMAVTRARIADGRGGLLGLPQLAGRCAELIGQRTSWTPPAAGADAAAGTLLASARRYWQRGAWAFGSEPPPPRTPTRAHSEDLPPIPAQICCMVGAIALTTPGCPPRFTRTATLVHAEYIAG